MTTIKNKLEYFNHKKFKSFFKRVRHMGIKVYIYYEINNSINLPAYIISKKEKLESLIYELWENNAIHHYIINGHIDIEIPADAEKINSNDMYGFMWKNGGPTNIFIISRNNFQKYVKDVEKCY